jgi:hypothetical protein
MAKRAASCYHVVSFYAGDLHRVGTRDRPRGFVRGTHGKATAQKEAQRLDRELGQHVFVRAVKCSRARRLFDLSV